MSAGVKVNLEAINNIAKKYEDDSELRDKITEAYWKLEYILSYFNYKEEQVYKKEAELVEDLYDATRAIHNNFNDISYDLYQYVRKMKEGNIVKYHEDVFVAKDRQPIRSSIAKIENKITEFDEVLQQKLILHQILESEFDSVNIETSNNDMCVSDEQKLREIEELKMLNKAFISKMQRCKDNQLVMSYFQTANKANSEIEEWYDRDFNAKNHANQVASIVVGAVIEGIIITGVVALTGTELVGYAVAAGFTSLVIGANEYNNGVSSDEAMEKIFKNFVKNMGMFFTGKAFSLIPIKIKVKNKKRLTNTEAKTGHFKGKKNSNQSILTTKKDIKSSGASSQVFKSNTDILPKTDEIIYNLHKKSISEILYNSLEGKTRAEIATDLETYISENTEIEISDTEIEILLMFFMEGVK